ncbi:MAG: four helix bundle suffix domain-containing protein [Muribaculaceae bacterium]|nr:four helix bundle suffix domain-containing protein [Muribaculaceae bacterium]
MPETFLPQKGNYRNLIAFQKAQCIYDITWYFTHKYLAKGDRTIDQMVQAARSGRQNIAEGSAAAATSSETEIKLINVARASLQELLLDYEDFLRVRNLKQWDVNCEKAVATRRVCSKHNDSAFYVDKIKERSAETTANIAITLIHQVDVFLRRLLERLQQDFVKNGGIKEQMFRARINYRNNPNNKINTCHEA